MNKGLLNFMYTILYVPLHACLGQVNNVGNNIGFIMQEQSIESSNNILNRSNQNRRQIAVQDINQLLKNSKEQFPEKYIKFFTNKALINDLNNKGYDFVWPKCTFSDNKSLESIYNDFINKQKMHIQTLHKVENAIQNSKGRKIIKKKLKGSTLGKAELTALTEQIQRRKAKKKLLKKEEIINDPWCLFILETRERKIYYFIDKRTEDTTIPVYEVMLGDGDKHIKICYNDIDDFVKANELLAEADALKVKKRKRSNSDEEGSDDTSERTKKKIR
ncbi:MAG: hypothetical protein V3580_04650 [Candidatus Cardinium sp.]|nr:hypothetical protein [Candidatus Cardinium sp.]